MCYHKLEAVAEKTVGNLTVRVLPDFDYQHCWDDTRGNADGCPIHFAEFRSRCEGKYHPPRTDPRKLSGSFEECEFEAAAEDDDDPDLEDLRDPDLLCDSYSGPHGYEIEGFFYASRKALVKAGECATEDDADAVFMNRVRAYTAEIERLVRGEVYGYEVVNDEGDVLDSCWGFVGEDDYCLAQGIEVAEDLIKDAAETARICEPYESSGNGD